MQAMTAASGAANRRPWPRVKSSHRNSSRKDAANGGHGNLGTKPAPRWPASSRSGRRASPVIQSPWLATSSPPSKTRQHPDQTFSGGRPDAGPGPFRLTISGLLGTALLPDGQLARWGDTLGRPTFRLTPEPEICYSSGPNRRHAGSRRCAFPSTYNRRYHQPGLPECSGQPWPAGVIYDVRRLFTTRGRSGSPPLRSWACSVSGSLMPRCCLDFLERSTSALEAASAASAIRSCRGRAGADRQPRAARALFRC